jgi:hypothetical protein
MGLTVATKVAYILGMHWHSIRDEMIAIIAEIETAVTLYTNSTLGTMQLLPFIDLDSPLMVKVKVKDRQISNNTI